MSVYVDNPQHQFGRMKMCHMLADGEEELLEMAGKIDVSTRWIQNAGTARAHFDICLAKRKLAVKFGAIEVSTRELVQKIKSRR